MMYYVSFISIRTNIEINVKNIFVVRSCVDAYNVHYHHTHNT
jgi:hypothetical protein